MIKSAITIAATALIVSSVIPVSAHHVSVSVYVKQKAPKNNCAGVRKCGYVRKRDAKEGTILNYQPKQTKSREYNTAVTTKSFSTVKY